MPKHHERRGDDVRRAKGRRPSGLRPDGASAASRRLARTVKVRAGALLLASTPSGHNAAHDPYVHRP